MNPARDSWRNLTIARRPLQETKTTTARALLEIPGNSWNLLEIPGATWSCDSWGFLGPPGSSWSFLAATINSYCIRFLWASWIILELPVSSKNILDLPGTSCVFLEPRFLELPAKSAIFLELPEISCGFLEFRCLDLPANSFLAPRTARAGAEAHRNMLCVDSLATH